MHRKAWETSREAVGNLSSLELGKHLGQGLEVDHVAIDVGCTFHRERNRSALRVVRLDQNRDSPTWIYTADTRGRVAMRILSRALDGFVFFVFSSAHMTGVPETARVA